MKPNSSNIYTYTNFSEDYLHYKKEYASFRRIAFINKIIKTMFMEIVDAIILEKECFVLAKSRYKVVRVERDFSKQAVNWGATGKLKQEILDRGGKLATKIGETEKGTPIFDDGEKYMVYFTDDFYTALLKINMFVKYKHPFIKIPVINPVFPESDCWKFTANEKVANVKLHEAERTNLVNRFDYPIYDRKRKNSFI